MGIEWREDAASRCAEAVQRSAEDNSACMGAGRSAKSSPTKSWVKREEDTCSPIRRTATGRGAARRVVEKWRVLSCGSREQRWRTKLYFGSRESLDDYHRPRTLGASPKVVRVLDA